MRLPAPPQGIVATRIRTIVTQNPGIHFRELGRAAALTSTGQLRHHLDRLARRGCINEVGDGRYRRYFPADHAPELQTQMARLSRELPRRILRLLLASPMTRTTMRRHLGCADSTLGYHLARMRQQGDLLQQRQGNACWYALADPERARRIVQAQEVPLPPVVGEPVVPALGEMPALDAIHAVQTMPSLPPPVLSLLPPAPPSFVPTSVEPLVMPTGQPVPVPRAPAARDLVPPATDPTVEPTPTRLATAATLSTDNVATPGLPQALQGLPTVQQDATDAVPA